jgi:outer membrane protein
MIVNLHNKPQKPIIMKTGSVLTLILFLSSAVVFGQLEKGNIFLQGSTSIGFNTQKYSGTSGGTTTEYTKTTSFNFKPQAGYFIINNLPVGLIIKTDFSKTKYTNSDSYDKNSGFIIGPFVRYYILELDKFKPMAEVYAGFGSKKSEYKGYSTTSEYKYGEIELSIGGGASYFLTDQVALDLLINYQYSRLNDKSSSNGGGIKSTTSDDNIEKYSGIGINLGLVVIIPGK